MMDKKECIDLGLKYYNNPDGGKLNCCESTLLALCSYMELADENIPAIATPFGGGIGGCGKTCGCLTGAAMAIGLRYGRKNGDECKDPATDAVRELMDLFMEKYGTTDCGELTGIIMRETELTDEEKKKLHDDVCDRVLSDTILWASGILDKKN